MNFVLVPTLILLNCVTLSSLHLIFSECAKEIRIQKIWEERYVNDFFFGFFATLGLVLGCERSKENARNGCVSSACENFENVGVPRHLLKISKLTNCFSPSRLWHLLLRLMLFYFSSASRVSERKCYLAFHDRPIQLNQLKVLINWMK